MAEPIEFLIVQHLQAALANMRVAEGYHYDVAEFAVKLDPNNDVEALVAPDGPRPFLLLEAFASDAPETWEYDPCMQLMLRVPLRVNWVSDTVPEDDASRMRVFLRGCADIERAVAEDISRGGWAIDTRITKRTFGIGTAGTQVWAIVDLEVQVMRTYGEPNA